MDLSTGNIIRASETSAESGKSHSAGAVIRVSDATVNVTAGVTLIKPEHFARQEMYFIQNGNFVSNIGHGIFSDPPGTHYFDYYPAGSTDYYNTLAPTDHPPTDINEDKVIIGTYMGGSDVKVDGYLTPAINFDGSYKTLNIDYISTGADQFLGLYTNITAKNGNFNFSYAITLNTQIDDGWISGPKSLDVSNVRGTYYIVLRAQSYTQQHYDGYSYYWWTGSGGQIRIKNLWLGA